MNKKYNLFRGILFSIPLLPIALISGFMAILAFVQVIINSALGNFIGIPQLEMMDFTDNISMFDWLAGGPVANSNSAELQFQYLIFIIPSGIAFALINWAFTKKQLPLKDVN
jgi:hypothetical protein